MRLPLTADIDSRDGLTDKDARLTNTLVEQEGNGPVAQVRPGLVTAATSTGNGNGLVCFQGELISVFGTTLGFDFVQSSGTPTLVAGSGMSQTAITVTPAAWYIAGIDDSLGRSAYVYKITTPGEAPSNNLIVTASSICTANALAYGANKVILHVRVDSAVRLYDVTDPSSPTLLLTQAGDIYGSIRFVNNRFVAVSSANGLGSHIHSSVDGVSWATTAYEDANLFDVAFGASKYVFCGGLESNEESCVVHSTNLSAFTLYDLTGTTDTDEILQDICYVGSTFYASPYGDISSVVNADYSSSDGVSWVQGTPGEASIRFTPTLDGGTYSKVLWPASIYLYEGGWVLKATANPCVEAAFSTNDEWVGITHTSSYWYTPDAEVTITPLSTLSAGTYDFTQSPL